LLSLTAHASVPDWVRAAAREALPAYSPETNAVVLLHERTTTVKSANDIRTVTRYVYKVLRPEGHEVATVTVHYDPDTTINWVKAWSISPRTGEYELKEKDAIDTVAFDDELYSDLRLKHFQLPAVEPGSIVAYEVDHRDRSNILQDDWAPQGEYPVLSARYSLELPAGWTVQAHWRNHGASDPKTAERRWSWELDSLPPIKSEPAMPSWRVLVARLAVNFAPPQAPAATWDGVGRWYSQLVQDRSALTPELRAKAAELVPSGTPPAQAARSLGRFVQRDVRYVAIEIGIGGYQPHAAQEVLSRRYGDCKDKVTLLRALLQSAGLTSYYVLTHSEHGFIDREFPSMLSFNHAILAIKLPRETGLATGSAFSASDVRAGDLLFFDPTSEFEPLGSLPHQLETNLALLVNDAGGELVELPASPAAANRLERSAKFTVTPKGALTGDVQETRTGALAADQRARLIPVSRQERQKMFESAINRNGSAVQLLTASIENLEQTELELVYRIKLAADSYAQVAPPLLLLRTAFASSMSSSALEDEARTNAMEIGVPRILSDDFVFAVPPNYEASDLPAPVHLQYPFADYTSSVVVENGALRFRRKNVIKQRLVTPEQLADLKRFYRQIREDEQGIVVIKQTACATSACAGR
jgi:transglutaminase-like putative cysteine protease